MKLLIHQRFFDGYLAEQYFPSHSQVSNPEPKGPLVIKLPGLWNSNIQLNVRDSFF